MFLELPVYCKSSNTNITTEVLIFCVEFHVCRQNCQYCKFFTTNIPNCCQLKWTGWPRYTWMTMYMLSQLQTAGVGPLLLLNSDAHLRADQGSWSWGPLHCRIPTVVYRGESGPVPSCLLLLTIVLEPRK